MKKIVILLSISIVFYACKKEEVPAEVPITILGTWKSNSQIFISDTSTYVFTLEDADSLGFNPIESFEFISNGTLYDTHSNGDIDTNEWFLIADSLHIIYNGDGLDGGGLEFVGKCEVTTTQLTLTGPDIMTNLPDLVGVHTVIMNATRE